MPLQIENMVYFFWRIGNQEIVKYGRITVSLSEFPVPVPTGNRPPAGKKAKRDQCYPTIAVRNPDYLHRSDFSSWPIAYCMQHSCAQQYYRAPYKAALS
ncbi:hypothetical protein VFPPC_16787 [Pochonia chlamydosporia 170]|uniref:Uncharacterized protein n=1 Tax=Pochonia chlamydosporia 170 TaxID=1380566 RepID=A0A179F4H0_METCM|nr:hypothetical protein VFPPC_16787 [Pochonia chlamydosporia 170]OAQ60261.1 hypothetical protein VFPPC_16787 [Pochonia chlamydosporia 170]